MASHKLGLKQNTILHFLVMSVGKISNISYYVRYPHCYVNTWNNKGVKELKVLGHTEIMMVKMGNRIFERKVLVLDYVSCANIMELCKMNQKL